MYNANINPYTGDMYHENPLILVATNFLINKTPLVIPYLIIALDLAAGWLLYRMAQRFIRQMVRFVSILKIETLFCHTDSVSRKPQ